MKSILFFLTLLLSSPLPLKTAEISRPELLSTIQLPLSQRTCNGIFLYFHLRERRLAIQTFHHPYSRLTREFDCFVTPYFNNSMTLWDLDSPQDPICLSEECLPQDVDAFSTHAYFRSDGECLLIGLDEERKQFSLNTSSTANLYEETFADHIKKVSFSECGSFVLLSFCHSEDLLCVCTYTGTATHIPHVLGKNDTIVSSIVCDETLQCLIFSTMSGNPPEATSSTSHLLSMNLQNKTFDKSEALFKRCNTIPKYNSRYFSTNSTCCFLSKEIERLCSFSLTEKKTNEITLRETDCFTLNNAGTLLAYEIETFGEREIREVTIYNTLSGKRKVFTTNSSYVEALAFNHENTILALAYTDSENWIIELWDISSITSLT